MTVQTAGQKESSIRQFSTFKVNDRLFGVDILDVKEVTQETEFTPIRHATKTVKGYVNIRGQVHLVLDLNLLLGFEPSDVTDTSRVVLFKSNIGENFGVLVDQVKDVVEVEESKIENRRKQEETPANEGHNRRSNDIGAGVCKLEDELLVVLNAKNMLNVA